MAKANLEYVLIPPKFKHCPCRVVILSPNSWLIFLRIKPYQDLAFVSVLGNRIVGNGNSYISLHPCHCDFSVYVTIMPDLRCLVTETS